jgi:hypothetical protein
MKIIYGAGGVAIKGTTPSDDFSVLSVTRVDTNGATVPYTFQDTVFSVPTSVWTIAVQSNTKVVAVSDNAVILSTNPLTISITPEAIFRYFNLPVNGAVAENSRPPIFASTGINSSAGFIVGSSAGGINTDFDQSYLNVSVKLSNGVAVRERIISYRVFPISLVVDGHMYWYMQNLEYTGAPGTLANSIINAYHGMIDGKTANAAAGGNMFLYSTDSGTALAPSITRNPNIFTANYSLAWQSSRQGANAHSGLPWHLITPRHVMIGHIGATVGQNVLFTRDDGGYELRTLTAIGTHPTQLATYIGVLDSPIATIAPVQVIPDDFKDYLPIVRDRSLLPVINTAWTQGTRVRFQALWFNSRNNCDYLFTSEPLFKAWSSDIQSGDSHGAMLYPINGKLVLAGMVYFPSEGPVINASFVNALLATVNSYGYAASTVDLSMYPKFPAIQTYWHDEIAGAPVP